MGIVKVNRTGTSVNVYSTTACTTKIGTITPNEVFTWNEEWSGSSASGYYIQSITFRNSSGSIASGWVAGKQTEAIFATNICSLCQFTKTISGVVYYGFKMRRTEELYSNAKDGKDLKISVPKDYRILCKSSTGGTDFPGRLSIYRVESGIGTDSYPFVLTSGDNVFIDMGYNEGSTFTTDFALIGSL